MHKAHHHHAEADDKTDLDWVGPQLLRVDGLENHKNPLAKRSDHQR